MAVSLVKTRTKVTDLKADLQTLYNQLNALPKEKWDSSLDTALKFTIHRLEDLNKELLNAEAKNTFYRGR